jgi:hypothetical protein
MFNIPFSENLAKFAIGELGQSPGTFYTNSVGKKRWSTAAMTPRLFSGYIATIQRHHILLLLKWH